MGVLQEEANLNEIVQLVGKDSPVRGGPDHPGDRQNDSGGLPPAELLRGHRLLFGVRPAGPHALPDPGVRQPVPGRLGAGGAIADLFNIPVREKIGRAKSVPAGEYREAYADMDREMEEELEAAAQKGERVRYDPGI